MKENASSDTRRSAASPEILRILLNHKVHYIIQKARQLFLPRQTNPVHDIASRLFQTYFSNTLPISLGFQRGLLVSGFPTKPSHAFFFSPKHATCPAHHIPLDFITIISGVENLSGSSSLCSCFRFPVTFFLVGANLRHLFLKTPSAYILIISETIVTPLVNGNTIQSSKFSNKQSLVTDTPSNTPNYAICSVHPNFI
jgi:hypothetical protein